MPNNKRKGLVLISIAIIAFLFFSNIFFVFTDIKDIKSNSYKIFLSTKNSEPGPICGDLFCDYANGENPLNCPEDCYMC